MERNNGYFKSLFDGLTMASTEVASATSMTKNPIDKALSPLFTNPQKKRVGKNDYVKFGSNDDVPDVLQALLNKSSTHAGIVHKKAKMVAGAELGFSGNPKQGAKSIEWKVFVDNAGGMNKSLTNVFKQAAFIYELQGAVGLVLEYDGSFDKLFSIKAVSPINLRALPPNKNGDIDKWLYRHTFKQSNSQIWENTETVIPVFDHNKYQKQCIIYVKNPNTSNAFYGLPNYISAFNFIEADYQFGVTINNSATNGFSPKVIASLIGRNLSDEQKREQADKLKENFQGSDGEQMMVAWIRNKDEMPDFKSLDISNLDRTIDTMASLNDSKILTAHSVVNPSMFGVQVAGKLGNTGVEMDASYGIFRATETLPTRELLLNSLQLALFYSQWKDVEVSVIDIPVFEEMDKRTGVIPADETEEEIKKEKE